MRYFLLALSIFTFFTSYSQKRYSSYQEWQTDALTKKSMLPRYGSLPKSEKENRIDSIFVSNILSSGKYDTRSEAAKHLADLGFQYLYRGDLATAMSRFNQSYLLDSTASYDYWGYGAVYMQLGNIEKAKEVYKTGLTLEPDNYLIWTDYATLFLAEYYQTQESAAIDSALYYFKRSHTIAPDYTSTLYKLSISYLIKNNCDSAWKYYDECLKIDGSNIADEYTTDLNSKCPR